MSHGQSDLTYSLPGFRKSGRDLRYPDLLSPGLTPGILFQIKQFSDFSLYIFHLLALLPDIKSFHFKQSSFSHTLIRKCSPLPRKTITCNQSRRTCPTNPCSEITRNPQPNLLAYALVLNQVSSPSFYPLSIVFPAVLNGTQIKRSCDGNSDLAQ